jgi:hypothetical protein
MWGRAVAVPQVARHACGLVPFWRQASSVVIEQWPGDGLLAG